MANQPIAAIDLPEYKIKELQNKGYMFCEDIDINIMQNIAGISQEKWLELTCAPKTKTALDIYEEESFANHIVTFSKEFDEILGGGVPLKLISEFVGEPGTGKTQMCMQLCVSVQIPTCFGGIEGHAVYIETSQGFTKTRFQEMATGCIHYCRLVADTYNSFEMMETLKSFREDNIADGIHFVKATKFLELLASVYLLENLLREDEKIKLVVIDCITKPFKNCELAYNERIKILYTLLSNLQELATKHNFAIILTNDMTTRFDTLGNPHIIPSLGESLAHRTNNRILLKNVSNEIFSAFSVKNILKPSALVHFKITKSEIRDVNGIMR